MAKKNENLRYDAFNEYLKGVKKFNDINIIKGLYSFGELSQGAYVDRNEDLKHGTKYSSLTSNKEFMSLFKAENFSKLDSKDLKHAFQELHNRYMAENNFDVTRNVAVVNDESVSAYGYVCANDNLMFINKHSIDKAKKIDPKAENFNRNNIGYSLFYVISHESQHVVQFENVLDYTINNKDKKQSKEDQFLSAMMAIENINMSAESLQGEFTKAWQDNYDYQFTEHNANYSAFKNTDRMIPNEEKKGEAYDQYNMFITRLALRKDVEKAKDPEKFIKSRIKKMEDFAKYEIDYFKSHTNDCPIKQRLIATLDEFMAVDENGNSPFREKLNREISEMMEVREKTKDMVKNNKKNKAEELEIL